MFTVIHRESYGVGIKLNAIQLRNIAISRYSIYTRCQVSVILVSGFPGFPGFLGF